MSALANDGFASICEIQHTSVASQVNNFFLTVFEDEDGQMFCSGRWERDHFGAELDLKKPRSVMMPILIHATKEIKYTAFDIFLIDAEYKDAQSNVTSDANDAVTVTSRIFVPELTEPLMNVFVMNAEGKQITPGQTIFADAELIRDEDGVLQEPQHNISSALH